MGIPNEVNLEDLAMKTEPEQNKPEVKEEIPVEISKEETEEVK